MVDLEDEVDDAEDSGENHGHSWMLSGAPVAPTFHCSRLSFCHLYFDSKINFRQKNVAELNDEAQSKPNYFFDCIVKIKMLRSARLMMSRSSNTFSLLGNVPNSWSSESLIYNTTYEWYVFSLQNCLNQNLFRSKMPIRARGILLKKSVFFL